MKIKDFKTVKSNLGSSKHTLYALTECGQLMQTRVDDDGKGNGWKCISEDISCVEEQE